MTSRERVAKTLAWDTPDRVALADAYWETTLQRWRGEGLPADASPEEYFDTDIRRVGGDYSMGFPERTVSRSENRVERWDSDGALRVDSMTEDGWTTRWLDFSIKTRDDWAKHRHLLRYDESRIPPAAVQEYRRARGAEKAVLYSSHACFHPSWSRVGMERLFMMLSDDPELVHELFAAHTQLVIDLFEGMMARGMEFDGAFLADDLGYVYSPLISPQMYADLVMPHHRKLCAHFASRGLSTMLHSDGNVAPLIPLFLEAGFAVLHPLEAKAGLDVRELKRRYSGRLILFGNIDARKLSGSRDDIDAEIAAKVTAAKEGGGYIYHSDHSVPHDVSFENYAFALERVRHYGTY